YKPANPIYQEVIFRTLALDFEEEFGEEATLAKSKCWVDGDKLHMTELLKEFQIYWRENSGALKSSRGYDEAIAEIILNAYLQRLLNSGVDYVRRQVALGSQRLDICARYKGVNYPIELKIKSNQTAPESLEQISGYMNSCGATEGWLVILDRDSQKKWDQKLYFETQTHKGYTIHLVGC
ncbi:MAG: hypothetical protein LBJ64_04045, partial [Deltaproteobacteria bacterium]|nr:hypothetical protein [Deltaproteobacteria bacterium]